MVAVLDRLVTILEPITLVVFATAWISAVVFLIRRDKNRFIAACVVGAVFIMAVMTPASILTARARHDLLRFLDATHGPFMINVGGQRSAGAASDSVLSVLRSTRSLMAHHSHPTDRVIVNVTDANGRTVNLALGRDSQVPREYWVFQTDYATTSNNEIGRVVTPLFDHR